MDGLGIIMDYLMMSNRHWIKDGFSGQRMTVIPPPLVEAAKHHPLLSSLHVTDAGIFPEAAAHKIRRVIGAKGAVLIVCRAGCGWLQLGGDRAPVITVGAGDVAFIPEGQPHAYGATANHPWTIQWVHFAGTETAAWQRWHGWPASGGVRRLRAGTPEKMDLGLVLEELLQGYSERCMLAAAAALRHSLSQIEFAMTAESGEPTRKAVEEIEAWMREHSGRRVFLAELARRAGLSVPHFSSLFRRRFAFAPIDYFLRLRIRRACELLDTTEWPIGRVAREVGFDDALYFSRRFSRVMGISPHKYRKSTKG